jgi:hypothetical protein
MIETNYTLQTKCRNCSQFASVAPRHDINASPCGHENRMSETFVSLLERLRTQPDDAAWNRLVELYTPLLRYLNGASLFTDRKEIRGLEPAKGFI